MATRAPKYKALMFCVRCACGLAVHCSPFVLLTTSTSQAEHKSFILRGPASHWSDSSSSSSRIMAARLEQMDGAYSWLVVISCLLANMMQSGICQTSGVFYPMFLEAFQESHGFTALITSINYGTLCLTGRSYRHIHTHTYI